MIEERFGESLKNMVTVTDRHSAYFAIDFLNNHICLANPLKQNLANLRKEFNELKRGLIKCRDYIFNFLDNPAIPSDNNGLERGIRKLKVK